MFSDPVVGEKFFGRGETLELLIKRAKGLKDGYRQNIAILGPNLIGKSSLILEFLSRFSQSEIISIYVDLRRNSFSHFIYKYLGAILYHYSKNRNLTLHEDLEVLKEIAAPRIPQTVSLISAIESDFKQGQIERAYENLLSLTSVLKQESGISSIVILDGFHFLDTFKLKNPYSRFAKEIMTQKDTMYILCTSQISYAKRILANELSLLFGNFEVIHLQPFDHYTSCRFLEKRFEDIRLPDSIRDFLIAFSKGHPFYLDIVSDKIKEKARELNQKKVTGNMISGALHSVMYDSKGILNQYFTSLLSSNLNGVDYAHYLPILISASKKGISLNRLSELTKRQPKVVTRQINSLLDKDLVSKFGVFYRIQDKMFRFWLTSVYQRKRVSLSADPLTESQHFCHTIENEIAHFSESMEASLIERLVELFRSFKNEIVTIQNKRYKLWRFEEVRICGETQMKNCLIAKYRDGYWACLAIDGEIKEGDVQEFFNYCRNSKLKIRKAIVISCKDWDLNVRLMALEKKMWVWELADLNLVLDLYGKQQIVF